MDSSSPGQTGSSGWVHDKVVGVALKGRSGSAPGHPTCATAHCTPSPRRTGGGRAQSRISARFGKCSAARFQIQGAPSPTTTSCGHASILAAQARGHSRAPSAVGSPRTATTWRAIQLGLGALHPPGPGLDSGIPAWPPARAPQRRSCPRRSPRSISRTQSVPRHRGLPPAPPGGTPAPAPLPGPAHAGRESAAPERP